MVELPKLVLLFIISASGCQVALIEGFSVRSSSFLRGVPQSARAIPSENFFSNRRHFRNVSLWLGRKLPSNSALFTSDNDQEQSKKDGLVKMASLSLRRCCWLSWWSQVILTTISTITLLFARSVISAGTRNGTPPGFFLAGTGISLSVLSILWTWGGARLARRLVRRNISRIKSAIMIRRAIRVGVILNLMGMLITLLGAEQIVGSLAARVLTMQGVTPFGNSGSIAVATQTLQPLDILVVQANTNTLLSHFVSLACTLWLTRSVHKLDPPSEDDENK